MELHWQSPVSMKPTISIKQLRCKRLHYILPEILLSCHTKTVDIWAAIRSFLLTTTNVVTMLTMIMTWFCSTNENTMLADVKETAFCVLWSQIRSLVWKIPWQSFRHPLLFLSCYDDIEIKTDVSIMLLYHI